MSVVVVRYDRYDRRCAGAVCQKTFRHGVQQSGFTLEDRCGLELEFCPLIPRDPAPCAAVSGSVDLRLSFLVRDTRKLTNGTSSYAHHPFSKVRNTPDHAILTPITNQMDQ